MSYQVIARKYRPQRFADVVGQEHVTQTLANAISQNRIAHAYLFCGPRGTGKTTIARIFAKCLNCTGGPRVEFDEADPRCAEITEGRSLDVMEIDGASNNGVEQVRELRETVRFAPASSKFKIFIIDEVHMLSTAAFNALLKTLEEPPAHVKFMFATTDPEKVLPTILSRCQRFDLRKIPIALIVKHLAQIAEAEKVTASPAALHALARGADGGMRDAESSLDQLISFCGNQLEENDVLSMFGLTSQTQVLAIALAILSGDAATVLRELDSLARNGKDLSRLLGDVLGHFRNLLVHQVSGGAPGLLEVSESEMAALNSIGSTADVGSLTRVMEVLTDYEGRMREAPSKRIFLEVAFLKAIQARNAVGLDAVLQKLKQLRSSAPQPPAAPTASAPTPLPKPQAPPTAQPAPATVQASPQAPVDARHAVAPSPAAVIAPAPSRPAEPEPEMDAKIAAPPDFEALWPQLLDLVGRASPFTRSYLLEAFPAGFERNTLLIGFPPEFADHIELVNNTKNVELLQTKLKELGRPQCYVKFVQATPPPGRRAVEPAPAPPAPAPAEPPWKPAAKAAAAPASATPAAAKPKAAAPKGAPAAPPVQAPTAPPVKLDPDTFKNDPLIKKALEIFRGRIVDVRG